MVGVQAQGYRAKAALDFETAFGQTPVAPNGIIMPIQSAKVQSKQTMIEDKTIRGIRDPAQPSLGNIDVTGPVVVPVDEIAIGYWLKALLGAPVTTGSGDPYTHIFKPGFSQPSFVWEQQFPDIGQYFLYNGCMVSKMAFNFEVNNNELTAQIDVMGAKETIGVTSFDDTLTQLPLVKFGNFQASVLEGGLAIATITKASLTIDAGLDGSNYTLGSNGFRGSINPGIMNVNGSITALFDSAALLNKAVNGTKSSLELKLTSGTHSLSFKLPEVMYERNSPGIDGPKGVLIDLPYRAFYDSNTDNASIVATLVNSQATY